jgi:hypothetical protein
VAAAGTDTEAATSARKAGSPAGMAAGILGARAAADNTADAARRGAVAAGTRTETAGCVLGVGEPAAAAADRDDVGTVVVAPLLAGRGRGHRFYRAGWDGYDRIAGASLYGWQESKVDCPCLAELVARVVGLVESGAWERRNGSQDLGRDCPVQGARTWA